MVVEGELDRLRAVLREAVDFGAEVFKPRDRGQIGAQKRRMV